MDRRDGVIGGYVQLMRDLASSGRACFEADEMDGVLTAQRAMLDATCAVDPLDELHEQTLTLDARPLPDELPPRRSINLVALRLQWMRAGYALALADSGPTPLTEDMKAKWAKDYAATAERKITE